jgi:hypothetical protein
MSCEQEEEEGSVTTSTKVRGPRRYYDSEAQRILQGEVRWRRGDSKTVLLTFSPYAQRRAQMRSSQKGERETR